MSRIGKLPISLPSGTTFALENSTVTLKGKMGQLFFTLQPCVVVVQEENELIVSVKNSEVKEERALWGLTRALVANMVTGVTEGFKKSLEIQGVGYKFEVNSSSKITLSVGFSHKVVLDAPAGIAISADEKEKNVIHISGIDKQQVGYFAALVRSVKKPEPYKGKGIRYVGEYVRRKAGKTAGK